MMPDIENLPGDPESLESNAIRMEKFAEALDRADQFLRNDVSGEFDSSAAKSIDALQEQAESIGEQYRSASSQYALCATGLARYAMTLDWVQRAMEPIVERYNELDGYNVLRGAAAAGIEQDLPEGMSAQEIQTEKAELRGQYNELYEEWEQAFQDATTLIGAGIQLSEPELDEPSKLEKVLDWLAIGGAILAIAAIWIPGVGWGAAAAGVTSLGIQGYRYSQGDASLGDLAGAGVGVIPFGRFYKFKALPDGNYQIVPGKGVNFAKTTGMSDESLEAFGQLSPQTQLLLTGAAYGDMKNTFDGLFGGVDAAGNVVYRHRDTGEVVEFEGLVTPPAPPENPEPVDRTRYPAR
ncbi:hypothetical protein [Ruania alba]|uniref:Uncharacterized protein n=1 Tax=Ruania alba TaxID=648782 RepID=A0A1H5H2S0_9MICO|nr:hypothetical protein [Ruania alba]SEE22252.1 hypothetical protein SAMN04488554_1837 [Ruania alba]